MKKLAVVSLIALTACSEIPAGAYFNRGEPESLIDVSSEVVTLPLSTRAALTEFTNTVAEDPPTRAELNCAPGETLCSDAKRALDLRGIPAQYGDQSGGVTLVYERVMARDCENRFIDNSINPYNLHPPTFGCSVAGNMVQQVSDKRQFVSPSLMDFPDGEKAVQVYERYLEPPKDEDVSRIIQSGAVGD